MKRLLLVFAPSLLLTLALAAQGLDALATAQNLYAGARYEEALGAFDAMKSHGPLTPGTALAVEQGRAYCLLALDRKADAQAAIAAVVDLDPFFVPGENDTAPKIRDAFRDARRRVLSDALDHLYTRAKSAYDSGNLADAAIGFSRVLALLDDPDLTLDAGPRADTRLTATRFLRLTQSANPTFDADAKDVTPPVPVRTIVDIPESVRPQLVATTMEVEVVLTAQGTVESATVRAPDAAGLAPLVVRAVLDWLYTPAVRDGTPVRYRMVVQVVIPPRSR
jgi:tetratricopeptide (TPR) repeat protein